MQSAPLPRVEEPRVEGGRAEEPRMEPKIDAREALSSAGLMMVETDRSKAQPQPEPETPIHLGRPRRERPKAPAQDDELVQVETRK